MFDLRTLKNLFLISLISVVLVGCAGRGIIKIPTAASLTAPAPIEGNTGEYMSPFTSDGVVSKWATKAISVKAGSAVGGAVGAYAGSKALEQIPFFGSWLGQKAGNAAGRALAINNIGGEEFIKETSDLSFSNLDDLAVYIYVKHSTHKSYHAVLNATYTIYPDLKKSYRYALNRAARK